MQILQRGERFISTPCRSHAGRIDAGSRGTPNHKGGHRTTGPPVMADRLGGQPPGSSFGGLWRMILETSPNATASACGCPTILSSEVALIGV